MLTLALQTGTHRPRESRLGLRPCLWGGPAGRGPPRGGGQIPTLPGALGSALLQKTEPS